MEAGNSLRSIREEGSGQEGLGGGWQGEVLKQLLQRCEQGPIVASLALQPVVACLNSRNVL